MGKSIRSKRHKRLRSLRRAIAEEQHYKEKQQQRDALLSTIVDTPSPYTVHLEQQQQQQRQQEQEAASGEHAQAQSQLQRDRDDEEVEMRDVDGAGAASNNGAAVKPTAAAAVGVGVRRLGKKIAKRGGSRPALAGGSGAVGGAGQLKLKKKKVKLHPSLRRKLKRKAEFPV